MENGLQKLQPSDRSIKDVDEFCKNIFGAIMQVVRSTHALPKAGDDHEFYSSFSGFQEFVLYQKERLIKMMSTLMKNNGFNNSFYQLATNALSDVDDYTDKLVECNDVMLERIAALLDNCENEKKSSPENEPTTSNTSQPSNQSKSDIVVSSWNKKRNSGGSKTFRLLHAYNILRPQLNFKDRIDNSNTPFIPKIKVKPHALKQLSDHLVKINSSTESSSDVGAALTNLIQSVRQSGVEDQSIYLHPYEYELRLWEPSPEVLQKTEPIKYSELDKDSCIFIDEVDKLQELLAALKREKEFAVDLEHHSYRSFQGITCLMQVSTRQQDYIVDTLALRSDLWILNEAFTDPKIVKVLHGADSDVLWLQRDLGIYVVNMFDTGQASRVLSLERFSLDYLANHYCNVQFDKKYQLADWRIRPLPAEMLYYAQSDTHYLLYIYDLMKNELLEKANNEARLLRVVYERSRDLCLLRYEKPITTPESHLQLLERMQRRRGGAMLKLRTPAQLEALRLLFLWRDNMARTEDESPGYVLPNHMLLQIAEILPKEAQGVLACCNPIPPLLRQHILSVHRLIMDARRTTSVSSTDKDPQPSAKVPVPARTEHESANLLTCPHDLWRSGDNTKSNSSENKKQCQVQTTNQSTLLGPFNGSTVSKGVFLSKNEQSACVYTKKTSEKLPQQKLNSISRSSWNPFLIFLPGAKSNEFAEDASQCKDEHLTLRHMLSGKFKWKMRQLAKPLVEEPETEIEEEKTFGKVLDIPKEAQVSTKEQVRVLNKMVKGKKIKNKPSVAPLMTNISDKLSEDLQFASESTELLPEKTLSKKVSLKPSAKKAATGPSNAKPFLKRPFQPHQYSAQDYRGFKRPQKGKKRARFDNKGKSSRPREKPTFR